MSRSSGARGSSAGVLAAFVAALTVVLLACGHDSTSPAASTVSIASGDTQKVFVGGSAAQPLVVLFGFLVGLVGCWQGLTAHRFRAKW